MVGATTYCVYFFHDMMLPTMRYLGIDYGSKRIGLALTDDKGMMAFPHSVIPSDGDVQKHIESLVAKEGVTEIVIGHSLNREGLPNKVHEKAEELMLKLTPWGYVSPFELGTCTTYLLSLHGTM